MLSESEKQNGLKHSLLANSHFQGPTAPHVSLAWPAPAPPQSDPSEEREETPP